MTTRYFLSDEERAHREKYPEATKWSDAHDDATVISNFLEWLLEKKTHQSPVVTEEDRETIDYMRVIDLVPEKLLKEYFEIDEQKLDKERRAMLDEHRKKNGEKR